MALVPGPVLVGLSVDERASVFERFTPKMTFMLPTLALVTIAGGITLLQRVWSSAAAPWLPLSTVATTVPALLLIGWQFDASRDWRQLLPFALAFGGSGAWIAVTIGYFAMTNYAVAAALGIVTARSVLGFDLLLPGEVRIYRETTSTNPDREVVGRIGMRNANLSGIQGLFQLVIVGVMVYMRWGDV